MFFRVYYICFNIRTEYLIFLTSAISTSQKYITILPKVSFNFCLVSMFFTFRLGITDSLSRHFTDLYISQIFL